MRSYQDRVLGFAARIRQTDDMSEIINLLGQALHETTTLNTHEELLSAREQVARAERSINELKRELEKMRALSCLDPLTGALNRRGLDDAFARESTRADRRASALGVVLIDLDDFKRLNDERGHQAGDCALAHVAAVMRATLRPHDAIGRFGGEEFLLLLPDTDKAASVAVIERLKHKLAASKLSHAGEPVQVTFSAGVVERSREESLDALIARADCALYQAKRSGKNRVLAAA
jgi:diguanylate cyclase